MLVHGGRRREAFDHLGRRVVDGADEHAGIGESGGVGEAGDAEVEDGDRFEVAVVVAGEKDVGGLDVPVDHALAVGVVERGGHLLGDLDDLGNRELGLAQIDAVEMVMVNHGESPSTP